MEYRTGRRFLGFRRLWYLRYRVYAVFVIFFSVFIVNQDTPNAIKTLVPQNSLTYKINNENVFAKQIETYKGSFSDKIKQVIHRGQESLYVAESNKLVESGEEYNKYKNYGYAFKTPSVDLAIKTSAEPLVPESVSYTHLRRRRCPRILLVSR